MKTGFGIIGTGMIAEFHARAISEIRGAELIGVFNHTGKKAQKFAQQFECKAFDTLEEMLANPEIRIVCICTPSGAHMEPAVQAAKAGKHIVVEKPLEITLSRCDQIIKACRESNVKLCTVFPSRYSPANIALKEAIDEGRFGKITLADTYVKWWREQKYYDNGAWRGTWALDGGGACMNQAIHNVDLLYWLLGEVIEVSGLTGTLGHERIEVEDTAVATIRFKKGSLGVIEATTCAWPGLLKRTEIHGTKGSAIVEQDNVTLWKFSKPSPKDRAVRDKLWKPDEDEEESAITGGAGDPKAISHAGHREQLKDFMRAIERGLRPPVDGEEGRRSVEIILALYQSAMTGQTVKLPLAADPILPGGPTAEAAKAAAKPAPAAKAAGKTAAKPAAKAAAPAKAAAKKKK